MLHDHIGNRLIRGIRLHTVDRRHHVGAGDHPPKMTYVLFPFVNGATVTKNCDPLESGPELAMARVQGALKLSKGLNWSAKA
jgi:hypothetical protein